VKEKQKRSIDLILRVVGSFVGRILDILIISGKTTGNKYFVACCPFFYYLSLSQSASCPNSLSYLSGLVINVKIVLIVYQLVLPHVLIRDI